MSAIIFITLLTALVCKTKLIVCFKREKFAPELASRGYVISFRQ